MTDPTHGEELREREAARRQARARPASALVLLSPLREEGALLLSLLLCVLDGDILASKLAYDGAHISGLVDGDR